MILRVLSHHATAGTGWMISRREGVIAVALYVVFVAITVIRG